MEKTLLKIVGSLCLIIGAFILNSNSGGPSGTDATGSPFDSNQDACTQCHTSFTLNSGTGNVSLSTPTSYYPGETYSITVDVSQSVPVPARYGFQTLALRDNNAAAGTMTAGSGQGTFTQSGRSYVQHNSTLNTTGTWTFTWNAPSFSDTVVFYSSGLAANGASGNSGDYVYTTSATVLPIAPITFTTSADTTSCFGVCDGEASVNVTGGGIPPYSYSWSNGDTISAISGLCAGTYTLTISDSEDHEETTTVVVPSSQAIQSNFNTLPSSCAFGSGQISVDPIGGLAPYTYLWSDTNSTTDSVIFQAGTGWFTVTITDANGCETIDSAEVVSASSGLVGLTNVQNESCDQQNGLASINMVAGNPPYDYLWNTGSTSLVANGLSAGQYTVTVTDDLDCVEVFSADVLEDNIEINTNASNASDISCYKLNDGSISVAIIGGTSPISYDWSHNGAITGSSQSNLFAGTYTITVSDSLGCADSITYTLDEPDSIVNTLTIDSTDVDTCIGQISIVTTGGTAPYDYMWSHDASNSTPAASDLCEGNYIITVTDINDCVYLTSANVNARPVGLDNINSAQIRVYPNPAKDLINITHPTNGTMHITLFDANGRVVMDTEASNSTPIDVSSLPEGHYNMIVTAETGSYHTPILILSK